MSKRSLESAESTVSNDLLERLKSAGNDVRLVHDLIEESDSASVAAAFVALLNSRSADAMNNAKHPKKVSADDQKFSCAP